MTSFLHYFFLGLLALGGLCILAITLVTALGWLMLRWHEFQDHDHDLDEPPTSRWARPEPRPQSATVILPYPRPANGTAVLARQRQEPESCGAE